MSTKSTPTGDDAVAALTCGMELAIVLELIENGRFPAATQRIHRLLDTAYDALMELAETDSGPQFDTPPEPGDND